MNMTECEGYKDLIKAVENDEQTSPGFHNYQEKLRWIIGRATHYAEKTGLDAAAVLNAWEARRDYWYMNYYQDSNQPEIKGDDVRVFETVDELKDSIAEPRFRCPGCGGVSTNAYKCNAGEECDWKSYGLFGTMGKGAYVFVKSEMAVQNIFMPISWEAAGNAAAC